MISKDKKNLQAQATFSLIYVIQKGKLKKDGTAPILARITINGKMSHVSTKLSVLPERWLPKEYKTVGITKADKELNETLEQFKDILIRFIQQNSSFLTLSKWFRYNKKFSDTRFRLAHILLL